MKNRVENARTLWPGGYLYAGDPVNIDSLALADLVSVDHGRGCDLGCGSGVILLTLLWLHPDLTVDGVELRPSAAAECRENLRRNGWEHRGRVENADLRQSSLAPGSFDLVISNPPYYPAGRGVSSPSEERRLMREESASLPELCAAAASLLKEHGRFYIVHRPARRQEVLTAMEEAGIRPLRIRAFSVRKGHPPSFFLCEGEKGGNAPLTTEPPLYRLDDRGEETEEYRKITHWEA